MCQAQTTVRPRPTPPTDPAEGWWWMDEVKLWMSVSGMCLCKCFVVFFNVLLHSLMLNTNSFLLIPNTCNFLTELVQSLWPYSLLLTVSGITSILELGLVSSIRDHWCSRLSFLFQSNYLHHQSLSLSVHYWSIEGLDTTCNIICRLQIPTTIKTIIFLIQTNNVDTGEGLKTVNHNYNYSYKCDWIHVVISISEMLIGMSGNQPFDMLISNSSI